MEAFLIFEVETLILTSQMTKDTGFYGSKKGLQFLEGEPNLRQNFMIFCTGTCLIIWLFISHLRSAIFRGDVFSYYKWLNVHVSSLKIYLISSKNMPCMVYSLCIFNFCIVYAKGFELFIENLTYTNSLHYFAQFFQR